MKKHFMIDLETMGIRPTSAIVSIGIVLFDQEYIRDKFYTNVSLASCKVLGLTTDLSTENWWAQESVEARAAWQSDDAPPLLEALTLMTQWMDSHAGHKEVAPWGNGADFDLVLLKNAFDAIDADPPWEFYNHHCFRTMKNMFEVAKSPRTGTHHNALDDAETQALHLQRILKVHNLKLPA
jgi:exodeoxyribonuclease VIII